jgi:hypothetical protein
MLWEIFSELTDHPLLALIPAVLLFWQLGWGQVALPMQLLSPGSSTFCTNWASNTACCAVKNATYSGPALYSSAACARNSCVDCKSCMASDANERCGVASRFKGLMRSASFRPIADTSRWPIADCDVPAGSCFGRIASCLGKERLCSHESPATQLGIFRWSGDWLRLTGSANQERSDCGPGAVGSRTHSSANRC